MSFTRSDPALEQRVDGIEPLLEYFRAAEKPQSQFRVGAEHEMIGLYSADGSPVPYEGERGIGALLARIASEPGTSPMVESGALLGVARGEATITLEPGGQLELSGLASASLLESRREFETHLARMRELGAEFGITWLGLGVHPLARADQVPRMPRERHALMRSFLAERGSLGLDMMHTTAGVQASFDFSSELDVGHKLRVGLAASPVIGALYANSAFSGGAPNGYESWRSRIWRDTDPARCGLLPFVFDDRFAEWGPYRAYAEWALDVPLFFVVRDGHHRSVGGRSFRQLLAPGPGEELPTLGDWHVHLTTLFPEVRLKRLIEVRGADCVPAPLVPALPALWKGLLYDPMSLQAAHKRLAHWTHADVDRLHADMARRGLAALTPDGPALEVARELLDLAERGLARLAAERGGPDERPLLEPIAEVLERGHSPARELLRMWEGPLDRRVDRLIRYAAY